MCDGGTVDTNSLSVWEKFDMEEYKAGRYIAGEKKLQGVLVGFVMKKSGGKADPKRVNQLLMSRASGG